MGNLGLKAAKLGLEDSVVEVPLTYLRGLFFGCWRKGHLLQCADHRYFLCVHFRQSPRAGLAPDTGSGSAWRLEVVGKADANTGSEPAVPTAPLSLASRVATVW